MLTDEQIITIRRNNDIFLKLIDLVRLTCSDKEISLVFSNIHKIRNKDEKILYLLFVYINNCDENYMVVLKDTKIIPNKIVDNFLENGVNVDNINSDILKEYLMLNTKLDVSIIIEQLSHEKSRVKNNKKYKKSCVDYNLNHLEKDNFRSVELRNLKLKRKIRRKILYDKYQREF